MLCLATISDMLRNLKNMSKNDAATGKLASSGKQALEARAVPENPKKAELFRIFHFMYIKSNLS